MISRVRTLNFKIIDWYKKKYNNIIVHILENLENNKYIKINIIYKKLFLNWKIQCLYFLYIFYKYQSIILKFKVLTFEIF